MARENDASWVLVLEGTDGMLEGQGIRIAPGDAIVVGRSRSCDVSTRRSRRFLSSSEEEQRRILDDEDFLKVSRRHMEVRYIRRGRVEIRDLSRNGTFVNGRRIGTTFVDPTESGGVELRMATTETFRLGPAEA